MLFLNNRIRIAAQPTARVSPLRMASALRGFV
jgi:hypothetical protein